MSVKVRGETCAVALPNDPPPAGWRVSQAAVSEIEQLTMLGKGKITNLRGVGPCFSPTCEMATCH
jgi:hypothetical protein